MTTHSHYSIDYIEFTVRDLDVAKRFCAAAFGWKFTDYGKLYAGIQVVDREVGGFHQAEEVRNIGLLVILYSEDLEASVKAVANAGDKILQEPFAFPGGRRFHFADPNGNELAVWSDRRMNSVPSLTPHNADSRVGGVHRWSGEMVGNAS